MTHDPRFQPTNNSTLQATSNIGMIYAVSTAGFGLGGSTPREAERALDEQWRQEHPPAYSHEGEAEAHARMVASAPLDLAWTREQAMKMGMTEEAAADLANKLPALSYVYVVKLQLYDLRVQDVEDDDSWASWLDKDVDLLRIQIPGHERPRYRFRFVTTRSLLGEFGVIKATKIFGQVRKRL
jgi:hypothetical protein